MSFSKFCFAFLLATFMVTGCSKDDSIDSGDVQVPANMVLVPAGSFSMGAPYAGSWSLPEHTVNIPAFYMDKYEVTNAQYKAFCDATSRTYPANPSCYTNYFTSQTYANYPVVNVSFDDAKAYAAWAGKRLPTEAEWERAAKGVVDNRPWPWGASWVSENANIGNNSADGYTCLSPTGAYTNGVSPVGCFDMIGNVSEWCEDDYHSNYTGAPTNGSAWIDNPRSSSRVIRGGSWNDDNSRASCGDRSSSVSSTTRSHDVGFRCAKTP